MPGIRGTSFQHRNGGWCTVHACSACVQCVCERVCVAQARAPVTSEPVPYPLPSPLPLAPGQVKPWLALAWIRLVRVGGLIWIWNARAHSRALLGIGGLPPATAASLLVPLTLCSYSPSPLQSGLVWSRMLMFPSPRHLQGIHFQQVRVHERVQ